MIFTLQEYLRRLSNLNNSKIVEYIIVNKELGMSAGKIASQVAHVQTDIDHDIHLLTQQKERIERLEEYLGGLYMDPKKELVLQWYEDWLFYGAQTKVILKAKEKDLRKAIEMGAFFIRDNGLTEIPAGSLTVVGFLPQPKSNLQEFTRRFQLL